MKYFKDITDLEIAKQRYKILVKQLHPDKGGSFFEFQLMQEEYKTLLLQLQSQNTVIHPKQSLEKELLLELGDLAKMLINKQIPQNYLRQKIKTSESPLKRDLFSDLVNLLDKL